MGSSYTEKNHNLWDPLEAVDDPCTPACIMRIQNDLKTLHADPLPGILVVTDNDNISLIHALIIGPEGTPYEGGFFHFIVRFPQNYPLTPPLVRIMTTENGSVRFNPNLYADGKVCLSILGTWGGPQWSPAQTLSSVLISVQSLLNEKPLFNEPGYESLPQKELEEESNLYNVRINHDTLRVAVCNNIEHGGSFPENERMPQKLRLAMIFYFKEHFDQYMSNLERQLKNEGKCRKTRQASRRRRQTPTTIPDSKMLTERLKNAKKIAEAVLDSLTESEQPLTFSKSCEYPDPFACKTLELEKDDIDEGSDYDFPDISDDNSGCEDGDPQ